MYSILCAALEFVSMGPRLILTVDAIKMKNRLTQNFLSYRFDQTLKNRSDYLNYLGQRNPNRLNEKLSFWSSNGIPIPASVSSVVSDHGNFVRGRPDHSGFYPFYRWTATWADCTSSWFNPQRTYFRFRIGGVDYSNMPMSYWKTILDIVPKLVWVSLVNTK